MNHSKFHSSSFFSPHTSFHPPSSFLSFPLSPPPPHTHTKGQRVWAGNSSNEAGHRPCDGNLRPRPVWLSLFRGHTRFMNFYEVIHTLWLFSYALFMPVLYLCMYLLKYASLPSIKCDRPLGKNKGSRSSTAHSSLNLINWMFFSILLTSVETNFIISLSENLQSVALQIITITYSWIINS